MFAPASAAMTRPPMPDLALEVQRLTDVIAELKQREAYLVRGISELLGAPKLLSAAVVDGTLTAVLQSGEVWRREARSVHTRDVTQYFDEWVPSAPVPGTRAAVKQTLDDRLAERVPLHLAPREVA
jgi:hypothetical protein